MRTLSKLILIGIFLLSCAPLGAQICIRVLCHYSQEAPASAFAFYDTTGIYSAQQVVARASETGIICLSQEQLDSLYRLPNGRYVVSVKAFAYEARDILIHETQLGDTVSLHLLPEPERLLKAEIVDTLPMDQERHIGNAAGCRDSSERLPGVITPDSAMKFLRERWYWTDEARQTDILWGRVFTSFRIDSLGYVTHVQTERSDHPCLAQILESSLRSLPRISEEGLGQKGGPNLQAWHYYIVLEFSREIKPIDRPKPQILVPVPLKKKKRSRRK